jgi:tape measure domain-containing protein
MDNKLRVVVSADTKSFVTGLNAASTKLKSFGNKAKDIGKSLSMSLTLPISAAGGMAIKSASDFEKLQTQLNVLTGSAEKGAEVFKKLVEFSAQTPFQLDELAKANNMLIGFGMSADDAFNSLKVLGDVAAVSGGDLNGIALAFGQASATGQLFAQDINQLINNGVPVIKLLAAELGVAESQVKKLASEGKIGFEDLRKAMVTATSEGGMFENGMQKLSKTFAGQFSTLKDNLNIAMAEFGKIMLPIALELTKRLTSLAKTFSSLDKELKVVILASGLLVAALPPLIAAFGQLSIVIGAVISPIGLIVAAFSTVTLAAVELLHRINPMVDRLNTFFNLIKSGGNIMSFQNLQIETVAKNLAEEHKQQEKLNEAKRKAKEDLDNLSKSYSNFQTTTSGRTQVQGLGANITTTGLQAIQTPEITASDDMSDLTNNFSSIEGKLRSVRNLAEQFGQSLMGAFETMGEGEPFYYCGDCFRGCIICSQWYFWRWNFRIWSNFWKFIRDWRIVRTWRKISIW